MRIGPLLILGKTNTPKSIVVAALHWKWSITWRWLLWYHLPEKWTWHKMWYRYPNGIMASITTPLGKLDFQTQKNMRRQQQKVRLESKE